MKYRLYAYVALFLGSPALLTVATAQAYSSRSVAVHDNSDAAPAGKKRPGSGGPSPSRLALGWSFVQDAAGGSIDRINDLAVDPGRAVLACGTSFEPARTVAYVMKLDAFTGDVIWTTRLGSTIVDTAVALVVDEEGSSYVAGSTTPSPPFPDVFLAKVDADGQLLWSYSFDEYDNNDEGVDVALGPDASVVVTGHANGLEGSNFFTAKLSRDGHLLWIRQLDGGEGSQTDDAVAVATDDQGGVLVTGTSMGPATGRRPDVLTAKYSPAGDLLWSRRHDGPDALHDIPWDLAATSDGGAVVVGTTEDRTSGSDPLVLRYGPDGSLLWSYDKGTRGGESARAVVLDPVGNIHVAGSTFTTGGGFDVLVLKFRPDGRRDWQLRWDGGEGLGDAGQAIALDTHGRVLVAATSFHSATETDVTTLVVDPRRGKLLASAFYDGPLSFDDAPLAVAADPGGGFFVGGFANFPFEDFLVMRYDVLLAL